MTDAGGPSETRPDLTQAPTKPDVLVRLLDWYDGLAGTVYKDTREMVADAMDAISHAYPVITHDR